MITHSTACRALFEGETWPDSSRTDDFRRVWHWTCDSGCVDEQGRPRPDLVTGQQPAVPCPPWEEHVIRRPTADETKRMIEIIKALLLYHDYEPTTPECHWCGGLWVDGHTLGCAWARAKALLSEIGAL